METTIGVFAARERAEEAVKSLLGERVPQESIVYMTRSESEAKSIGKELGAYAGGFVGGVAGLSAGVAAATLLAVPGIGPVFALGFGAAALLGLVGAGTGAAVGASAAHDRSALVPTSGNSEDAVFFRQVLNEGHSLIVVRTESLEIAATACQILEQLGINMEEGIPQKSRVSTRESDGVTVIDIRGRIVLGDGTALLRDTMRDLLARGEERIVLNLEGVEFVDSAGLGELVRTHVSIRTRGGQLKLVSPGRHVHDLLRITKLERVFDIEQNETSALDSLRRGPASSKAAG
jgi:anti-sigma B factor antagonist